MLSKISKTLLKSVVRANQVFIHTLSLILVLLAYSKLSALPPEVSPILTKTKTLSERAPLIKITGRSLSLPIFIDL